MSARRVRFFSHLHFCFLFHSCVFQVVCTIWELCTRCVSHWIASHLNWSLFHRRIFSEEVSSIVFISRNALHLVRFVFFLPISPPTSNATYLIPICSSIRFIRITHSMAKHLSRSILSDSLDLVLICTIPYLRIVCFNVYWAIFE